MNLMQKKIAGLETKIKDASQQYYQDGSSPLTDAEFDAAVGELRELAPDSPIVNSVGFGYDINEDSTPGERVKHKYGPAGSLTKAYSYDELRPSLRGRVFASLKLDGLSVVCYYRHSELYQALTRGGDDGSIGIDITEKIKCITPNVLPSVDFTGAIRGEIVMSHKNFERFKEIHPDAKNARNSTAGLINSKSVSDELKFLNLVFYQIVGLEYINDGALNFGVDYVFNKIDAIFKYDNVVPYCIVEVSDAHFIDQMNSLKDSWYGKFPADGIVLTSDALLNKASGYVKYEAQAFKFDSEEKQTEVVDVEWNLTKTRYLMPRVNLKAVELAGTSVQWATGYNAQYIKDNNIGPGAIVTVEKHGEIIPNINKVIRPAANLEIPTRCPECSTDLVWNGVHLQCPNDQCSNASRQDLSIWMENIAPVDGLGDSLKFKFLEMLFGDNLSVESVMSKKDHQMHFMMARSGHKLLMHKMFTQLLGNGKIKAESAIKALNIPRLGDITSTKLAQHKNILQNIYSAAITDEPLGDYSDIIGAANMQSIVDNLNKFSRLRYIIDRIVYPEDEVISEVQVKGKVAITGKLSVPRKHLEYELRAHGYEPGEISKDTKFLITDDPNSTSSKNKKASEWGIEKITEADFRRMYLV